MSAIRWRLLQTPHRATTTPFSYDSRLAIFMDLVSQTLHVKIIARSCLGEIFRLDASLTLKLDSAAVGTAGAGGGGASGLESSGSWRHSRDMLLVDSMIVWKDLNPAVAGEGIRSPAMTRVPGLLLIHSHCRSAIR